MGAFSPPVWAHLCSLAGSTSFVLPASELQASSDERRSAAQKDPQLPPVEVSFAWPESGQYHQAEMCPTDNAALLGAKNASRGVLRSSFRMSKASEQPSKACKIDALACNCSAPLEAATKLASKPPASWSCCCCCKSCCCCLCLFECCWSSWARCLRRRSSASAIW